MRFGQLLASLTYVPRLVDICTDLAHMSKTIASLAYVPIEITLDHDSDHIRSRY